MFLTIDRFENGTAICFDDEKKVIELAIQDLPADVHEGSVLWLENGVLRQAPLEENSRRERIEQKANELWN